MKRSYFGYQLHDYSAAAMVDGLILAHDTGLGKSLAAVTIPLLKCGFDVIEGRDGSPSRPRIKAPVLIVAPGDLHDQFIADVNKFFDLPFTRIRDQAHFNSLLVNRKLAPGFYIVSYSVLCTNGVAQIKKILELPVEMQISALNLTLNDVLMFWQDRGKHFADDYNCLGLTKDATIAQIDSACARKQRLAGADGMALGFEAARQILTRLRNFEPGPVTAWMESPQPDCVALVKSSLIRAKTEALRFVWEHCLRWTYNQYRENIGVIQNGIKCVYSPSLADLSSHSFEDVVVDEGVKMKGADTGVGRGIRQMSPRYRHVLTATPIKNRLPDIFFLAWWAAGGNAEATARWPYGGEAAEQEKFAETFMLSEFNRSAFRKNASRAPSRFTRRRPEICNLHLLWKALGPVVLRRRKQDTGVEIVKKVRQVYRVPMGLFQRSTYRYHVLAKYLDHKGRPAPGARLQALRVASAAPDSKLLEPRPIDDGDCHCCSYQEENPGSLRNGLCVGCGSSPISHQSPYAFIPKVAAALTIIRDILGKGEQVAVFSAFNDPSDTLSGYLAQAGIQFEVLDGRKSQKRRGKHSAAFNGGAFPVTLAGLDSMAEGHNWDKVRNIILTSYTWAADKIVQAINRIHRITSRHDVNVWVIICDQSADRVLEDNINEKVNSSELAIDGQLLGESTEEKSIADLLEEALKDFAGGKDTPADDYPDERELKRSWPALREQLADSMKAWRNRVACKVGTAVPAVRLLPAMAKMDMPPVPWVPSATELDLSLFFTKPQLSPVIDIAPATQPQFKMPWDLI